jgi:hypothetical protein
MERQGTGPAKPAIPALILFRGELRMSKTVIELDEHEVMRFEAILMDEDEADALVFLKQVIRPKLRSKSSSGLDPAKSTGIMT